MAVWLSCSSCERHIKSDDACCPFCGASAGECSAPTGRVERFAKLCLSAGLALGLSACSNAASGETSESGEASSGSGTVGETTASTSMSTTSESESESESTEGEADSSMSGGFYAGATDLGDGPCQSASTCDIWAENDCAEGEKCAAISCVGSSWDTYLCMPIQGDKEVGETCEAWGGVTSGNDDCVDGAMCFAVDPATGLGTCHAFCTGSPQDPVCPAMSECSITSDGVLTICLPSCDPVDPSACDGDLCVPTSSGDSFACTFPGTTDPAPYGTPCEYINVCDPGLACLPTSAVPELSCEGANGCCSPFCDTSAANTCPGVGQVCESWFEGTPPEGYENVGVCAVPSP